MARHRAHTSNTSGVIGIWLLGMAMSGTAGLTFTVATGMWGEPAENTVNATPAVTQPTVESHPDSPQATHSLEMPESPQTPDVAVTQPTSTATQPGPTVTPKPAAKPVRSTPKVTKKPVTPRPTATPQPATTPRPIKKPVKPQPADRTMAAHAPTAAEAAVERQAMAWLNKYRTTKNLPQFASDSCARTEAAKWSDQMRREQKAYHNPAPTCGPKRAENVAAGGYRTATALMEAWQRSAGHNANMVSSKYTHAAVAVRMRPNQDGRMRWYATTVFLGK